MRVLIADDSTTMHRIEIAQLNGLGVTDILEAVNGKEALDKLKAGMPVDVVLLDINMPVMDGMAVLKAIRGDPAYADVKVVMVTSEADNAKVVEALRSGANDYIVKPFGPDVFRERLM